MGDEDKTQLQLLQELATLRQTLATQAEALDGLRAREARLRLMVEAAGEMVFTLDAEARHTSVLGRWPEDPGLTPEALLGRTAQEALGEAAGAVHLAAGQRALTGEHVVYEWSVPTAEGPRYYQTSLSPVSGNLAGVQVVGIGREITARKLMEAALLESEEQMRWQFRAIPVPTYIWRCQGEEVVLTDYNDAAYSFTQGQISNWVGASARQLYAHLPEVVQDFELCARERLTIERERPDPLGAETKYVIARYVFIPPDRILVLMLDITERQKLEKELADAKALLEAAFEQTPIPMMLASAPDQVLRIVNSAALEFLGIEDEPSYVGRPLLAMQQTWKDFDAEGAPVRAAELPLALAFKEIIIRNREYRVLRKDQTARWELMSGTPVYNEAGELMAAFVAFPDITDRKQAEGLLRTYTARLERSNRELQDFASSASHDLQEPLRKIQMFGDLLKGRQNEQFTPRQLDYIERMSHAAGRMQEMINALLDYSRVTTKAQPFGHVDLAQVAAEAVSDLEARIEQAGGVVEVGALPSLEADAFQLRLLLQNLIGNALKFHRPGVAPVVRVWGQPRPPNQVELQVADNGIGFDELNLDRLFRPFERLHGRSEYEGSGMGLAICRKIVERHGGTITAHSALGLGTTFIVTLPQAQPDGDTVA